MAESRSAGLAHVAAVSFLAARAVPFGGFWVTLAGGVALARAGERLGLRRGYGASVAAMLQSVAMLGPARLGVPLTQALSAPLLGRMHGGGDGVAAQVLACAVIRTVQNLLGAAFLVGIVTGVDAYSASYDEIVGGLARLPVVGGLVAWVPLGTAAALAATAVALLAWSAFASTVQVLVYRRGLDAWSSGPPYVQSGAAARSVPAARSRAAVEPGGVATWPRAGADPAGPRAWAASWGVVDPRAITLAAAVAFGLLLVSTEWLLLASVGAWLALAWTVTGRFDRDVVPAGLLLAAVLALSAFGAVMVGGLGLDVALRRAARAGLLVLVATWLRAAAGSEGVRDVARRGLHRLRAVPGAAEAGTALDEIGAAPRLAAAGRSLFAALGSVRRRPLPIVDAVLDWVRTEAARFEPAPTGAAARLAVRPRDVALVILAACPAAALFATA